ncbi:uncharacterized protein LOC129645921 isoform X19 [Bubalus kerabau]|uniref:uncharacterized protein LOC129645921 isoform X19 n=1 Tax=Bubalus carabanensis TaxID=3119969 RepID=UPI00244EDD1C|nr:uncharacterized protein LOC129645921 isoform X19 [Bubalus carabanensis]
MALTLLQGVMWPEPRTRSSVSMKIRGSVHKTPSPGPGTQWMNNRPPANHLDCDLPSSSGPTFVSCKGRSLFLPAALRVLVLDTLPLDCLCCRFSGKG